MLLRIALLITSSLWLALPAPAIAAAPGDCMPRAQDYTLMSWANGWAQGKPVRPEVMCIQSGRYALAIELEKVQLLRLGEIRDAAPYAQAATQRGDPTASLPEGNLVLSITVGQTRYRCVRGAVNQKDRSNFPVRIIESGRFFQHFDILQLQFEDEQGGRLNGEGRLEVAAWPDRVAFILEFTAAEDLPAARLQIALGAQVAARDGHFRAAQPQRLSLSRSFDPDASPDPDNPADAIDIAIAPAGGQPLPVHYEPDYGWHRITLPRASFSVAREPDRLERYSLTLHNRGDHPRTLRLLFDAADGTPGITGISAMLRDPQGHPTGIPVQLSKNWHRARDGRRFLYEGPWFHGLSLLRLPANSELKLEYDMAWARWGGVPAASHAQLCLIGWGTNQVWDQAAIGSWGESICYEPDICQNRGIIDDVRPLMVNVMNQKSGRWGWTNNVGGGDFLVYYDQQNQRQFLTGMRTAYLAHGPNLTHVIYAGVSADGAIAARIDVSSPRCDDLNRAYHRFRYDVLKPAAFSRLAFYQLGADQYNDHQFNRLARGNEQGMIEQWTFPKGGRRYDRTGMPCEGRIPWFSLHEAVNKDTRGGAWANRGLVIRQWKARLGGKDVPTPFASCYGTVNGPPGMNVELSAPPDLKRLLPGDYVEAEVELLVLPMSAEDYYGPNDTLRESLKTDGNTWRPVYRQAIGNDLRPRAITGQIVQPYPLVMQTEGGRTAAVEITGGVGYVPVTFAGLADYRGYELTIVTDGKSRPLDQSVHGNDFWQTDYDAASRTWRRTYNIDTDELAGQPFRLLLTRP